LRKIVDKLRKEKFLEREEFVDLIQNRNDECFEYISSLARVEREKVFGKKVYIRGLIEFTNYCKNDCFYCGIRKSNKNALRYRLNEEDILKCCKQGYELGFRTFVLQGGEDLYYCDELLCHIVENIKKNYADCAVTLSVGERNYQSYKRLFDCGADRYLLRQETAGEEHYKKLHPSDLSLENRKQCLFNLKEIGYQVGCGFMVGSPYQTVDNIVDDLFFINDLKPHMIGIGPFISHCDTKFAGFSNGSVELTLFLLSILRLMFNRVLLPATTALGTLDKNGREKGILAGANVLMPNLSPVSVRKKYSLYDNKICTGDEAAECNVCLRNRMKKIGYEIVEERGDF